MIKEIAFNEFEQFVNEHPLINHYQTINYAMLMTEHGFDYDLIGYFEQGILVAASLIIFKNITSFKKYGYAPKGFLIDYLNPHLLERFTIALTNYYERKNVVFIKINPELVINEIDLKTKNKKCQKNIVVKNYLQELGYFKLKDNLYFESVLPRFNAFVDLRNYDFEKLNKNTRNKIKRAESKGLNYEIVDRKGIDILFEFIKNKRKKDVLYYKHYYNMFEKTNNVDVFLVYVDYNDYLVSAKKNYEEELEKNAKLNSNLIQENHPKNINNKMESDKRLLSYKNDVLEATKGSSTNEKKYIAGAMVLKYKNRVDIVISGYEPAFRRFNANYYLHYAIIEYYKNSYEFLDLNGITGDFTSENPYSGLNSFKLGFNPKVYELIGEYDLLLMPKAYKKFYNNGTLANALNKKEKKK